MSISNVCNTNLNSPSLHSSHIVSGMSKVYVLTGLLLQVGTLTALSVFEQRANNHNVKWGLSEKS